MFSKGNLCFIVICVEESEKLIIFPLYVCTYIYTYFYFVFRIYIILLPRSIRGGGLKNKMVFYSNL